MERYDERKFVTIAANIETTVIRVPAGFQDYYSALHGGTNCIRFRPDGIEREELKIDEETLQRRIAICYTGEPRLSGTNNWEITKNHIDGDHGLFKLFDGIRIPSKMRQPSWRTIAAVARRARRVSESQAARAGRTTPPWRCWSRRL